MSTVASVPDSVNVHNLNGVYNLNRQISDPTDAVLKMQGVGWLVRQAIAFSAVTVTMKQYTDNDGIVHIDADQVSTGGIKSLEDRTMDWQWHDKDDRIWGKIKSRSRLIKFADLDADPYLKEGWEQACVEGDVIENQVEGPKGAWTAHQIWGFAEVEGARRRVQRVVTGKPGAEPYKIRVFYDWKE